MTTEVTQEMWEDVMGSNPSSGYGVGPSYPVYNVSWDDCMGFIDQLNSLDTEYEYRLPSEAEWEYACRAGTTTAYYWGDEMNEAYCWFGFNSGQPNSPTHPVGQKLPNAWGLYDMSGNVGEWCYDWYHDTYSGAPQDGGTWISLASAWVDEDLGYPQRVYRGGSRLSLPQFCRSSQRNQYVSAWSLSFLGFRLVRSAR